MHIQRLHVPIRVKRYRWPLSVGIAALTGLLPIGVSGVPEFCAIVILPFYLGYVIIECWEQLPKRMALALALPLLGSVIRLTSSSLCDGSNWFAHIFAGLVSVGLSDPYSWQTLLMLLFPVSVTLGATVMFVIFQNGGHARDASYEDSSGKS
jgi:hypothetical protein